MKTQRQSKKQRRDFIKICGSVVAAAASGSMGKFAVAGAVNRYEKVQLTMNEKPVRASDLPVGETYIFNYPYVTTPCMIMNIGKSAAASVELTTET